jgi:hypothetical protein
VTVLQARNASIHLVNPRHVAEYLGHV